MASPAPPAAAEAKPAEDKKPDAKTPEPPKSAAEATPAKKEAKEETPKKANDESKKENTAPNKKAASKPPSNATSPTSSPQPGADPNKSNISVREQFKAFSKFGDTKSDGKQLTLSQSDKWMKQAKVIDGKTITTTDTAIHFKKYKQMKLGYQDYEKYLEALAKAKKVDLSTIKTKLRDCGAPAAKGTTSVVRNQAVDRLTDTSKYTGSHKLRFDETGKGKGAEGRREPTNKTGYVAGYKNKDTYDKSH